MSKNNCGYDQKNVFVSYSKNRNFKINKFFLKNVLKNFVFKNKKNLNISIINPIFYFNLLIENSNIFLLPVGSKRLNVEIQELFNIPLLNHVGCFNFPIIILRTLFCNSITAFGSCKIFINYEILLKLIILNY